MSNFCPNVEQSVLSFLCRMASQRSLNTEGYLSVSNRLLLPQNSHALSLSYMLPHVYLIYAIILCTIFCGMWVLSEPSTTLPCWHYNTVSTVHQGGYMIFIWRSYPEDSCRFRFVSNDHVSGPKMFPGKFVSFTWYVCAHAFAVYLRLNNCAIRMHNSTWQTRFVLFYFCVCVCVWVTECCVYGMI